MIATMVMMITMTMVKMTTMATIKLSRGLKPLPRAHLSAVVLYSFPPFPASQPPFPEKMTMHQRNNKKEIVQLHPLPCITSCDSQPPISDRDIALHPRHHRFQCFSFVFLRLPVFLTICVSDLCFCNSSSSLLISACDGCAHLEVVTQLENVF